MRETAYARAVAFAQLFLRKHFTEKGGEFRGSGNCILHCDGAEKYTEISDDVGKKRSRKQNIFAISIGERHQACTGSASTFYFLKIQLISGEKKKGISVIYIGSKTPHPKIIEFQKKLGNIGDTSSSFPFDKLERILEVITQVC